MEEEIKKMLYEKIKYSEQGLTNGEVVLAIYLLDQEKKEKWKTISTITQTGEGIQTTTEKAMKENKGIKVENKTDLLNRDIEYISINENDEEIVRILANINKNGEIITGKENINVHIKYTDTDVMTIIEL